jgi:hypothetical protein
LDCEPAGGFESTGSSSGTIDASQIDAQVDVDRGKISFTGLRGQLFQGTHEGDWLIDASKCRCTIKARALCKMCRWRWWVRL